MSYVPAAELGDDPDGEHIADADELHDTIVRARAKHFVSVELGKDYLLLSSSALANLTTITPKGIMTTMMLLWAAQPLWMSLQVASPTCSSSCMEHAARV
jgi:hypothetical protein